LENTLAASITGWKLAGAGRIDPAEDPEQMMTKVILCCGVGGVGKTTLSGAIAVKFANQGLRTALITIDPAKRLADSLGLQGIGNTPQQILDLPLFAMMLEPGETFDNFTLRNASSKKAAERLLQNRYYQFASRRMGGVQEYMAMVKLLTLAESGSYDLLVVDTPPAQHAIDFLKAPERMGALVDQSFIRHIGSEKGNWRALSFGAELIGKGVRQLLGREMIDELSSFFSSFSSIGAEMHRHSKRCSSLLRSERTRFLLVTSPGRSPSESRGFLDEVKQRGFTPSGLLINRVPPVLAAFQEKPYTADSETLRQILEWSSQQNKLQAMGLTELKAIDGRRWLVEEQDADLHSIEGLQGLNGSLPDLMDLWTE
jgi:anion-transporting  ArsA/GET3 family ATPase